MEQNHSTRPLWARLVSTVLHPLVMPLVTLILLFYFDLHLRTMPGVFLYLGLVVLVNTLAPCKNITNISSPWFDLFP